MTDSRIKRQKAIADLIRSEALGSQEEVTARLKALGFQVTQGTVSRDLDQMAAVKVKRGGALRYALPDEAPAESDWAGQRLGRILAEWVLSIETAGHLIVIRTPPGSGNIVGLALDQAKLKAVAGTICGDDTIFVALTDGAVPGAVAGALRKLKAAGGA